MNSLDTYFNISAVFFGLLSAAGWLRAATVKVSHERAMAQRTEAAAKKGEKPNFASVSLDGWDMSATFTAQARWNSIAAFLAACSILFQAVSQLRPLLP